MKEEIVVGFTAEEAARLYELIHMLSGGNPENVFAWDGTDSLDLPTERAAAKLFKACGKKCLSNVKE